MADDHEPTPFERLSAPWLARLSRIPRWLFMVGLAALLLTGLLLENALGGLLLLVLAAFLGWLATLGWSRLSLIGRLLRLLTLALLVYAGVVRMVA